MYLLDPDTHGLTPWLQAHNLESFASELASIDLSGVDLGEAGDLVRCRGRSRTCIPRPMMAAEILAVEGAFEELVLSNGILTIDIDYLSACHLIIIFCHLKERSVSYPIVVNNLFFFVDQLQSESYCDRDVPKKGSISEGEYIFT